ERSIPYDLKGQAELRFDLLGVQAQFVIPANFVQMTASLASVPGRVEVAEKQSPRLSDTALIVEDNLIIAMSAEVILLDLGARHVETAASVGQAVEASKRLAPSFPLLDLNLGNENSIPVGKKLTEMKIPFIFATGYGERAPIPPELSSAPVIQKPYTKEVVEGALARLGEREKAQED